MHIKRFTLFHLLVISFFFYHLPPAYAHPGRTAADGCHYCRTNCDSWGVPWNERHCHGGGSVESAVTEQQPVYTGPTNTPRPLPTWTSTPRPPTPTNTPRPTSTPLPSNTPTVIISPTFTPSPTKTKEPTPTKMPKVREQSTGGFWGWILSMFF